MLVLLAAAALASAGSEHTQPWLYAEADGRGPSQWGSMKNKTYPECGGRKQSPLNIAGVREGRHLMPLQTTYSVADGISVTNNGHSIDVVPRNNTGNYLIDPNQGHKKYELLGIHFHSPSEHGIGGGLFDLELHFVHKEVSQHQPTEGHALAVIAVLFRASDSHNSLLGWLSELPENPLAAFPNYVDPDAEYEYETAKHDNTRFDFGGLLGHADYYTYSGSLTTPPCTEAVKWYVKTKINTVSRAQLQQLRNALNFNEEKQRAKDEGVFISDLILWGNNRPLQPAHGREVLMYSAALTVVQGSKDSDDSTATVAITLLAILALLTGSAALSVVVVKHGRRTASVGSGHAVVPESRVSPGGTGAP